MKLQLTLVLICVLLPKALTLECNQCIPDMSGTCTDTQTTCPDRCVSATLLVSAAGVEQTVSTKDCAAAAECVNGNLNLGVVKRTINTQCCTADLCNSQNPAVLPFGSPNGKKCYTCINNDCRGTASCEGDQDRCISTTDIVGDFQVTMKGCVSRNLCTADPSTMLVAGIIGNVSCCEGNLCNAAGGDNDTEGANSAERVKLGLLIMLASLISSTLFI